MRNVWIFLSLFLSLVANVSQGKETMIKNISIRTIDGQDINLGTQHPQAKAFLIVNTASQCGYTPQYEGLQKLHEEYQSKGLVVLAFPSNDFGAQEPGSEKEIKNFCETKYKVTFPLYAKVKVKGADKHALYKVLSENSLPKGEPKWNFEKYLLDSNGKSIEKFSSNTKPSDSALRVKIEALLK